MKLSKETVEYILAELVSRMEVLNDLIMYGEDKEQLEMWEAELVQCEQVIAELSDD